MSSCSIVNKDTRETNKFYKADNGEVFASLSHALSNSTSTYEIGFKNEFEEFTSVAKMAVHPQSTLRGSVQNFIKTEYLKPNRVSSNEETYIAQNSIAAEMIEEELVLSHPFNYLRRGNEFTFYYDNEIPTTYEERVDKYDEPTAAMMGVMETYYQEKYKSPKLKLTRYTKEELYQAITNFMNRIGISKISIDEYIEKYKLKFGVEPDAKMFIDINNKIIAVAEGQGTIEDLSEEVAHFIIEGWDPIEINRLLDYVPLTEEYVQNHERYTAIYSKQNTSPEIVERYVRKEILGKMLAKTFQRGFSIENSPTVEKNFFNRLGEILKQFIDFIKTKITSREVDEITIFTNEINNLLFNEKIHDRINSNPQSDIDVMYSVGDTSEIDSILNNLEKIVNENKTNTEIPISVLQGISLLHNRITHIHGLLNSIKEHITSEEDLLDGILSTDILTALEERDSIDVLKGSLVSTLKTLSDPQAINLLNSVQKSGAKLSEHLSKLNSEFTKINKTEPAKAVDLWAKAVGAKDYLVDLLKGSLDTNTVMKDAFGFVRLFAHVGKTSNSLVNMLANLGLSLFNEASVNNWNDTQKYGKPLINNAKTVNSFVDKGTIKSSINTEKIDKAKKTYEYEIRQKLGIVPDNMSLEDFLDKYDDLDPVSISNYGPDLYYKYDREYKRNYSLQSFTDPKLAEYYKTFSDNMDRIDATPEFYQAMMELSANRYKSRQSQVSRDIEKQDQSISRRKMSNIFNSNTGELKTGLKLKRFSELKTGESYASLNHRKLENSSDFVVVIDPTIATTDSKIAYDMLKWNAQIFKSLSNSESAIRQNFISEYKKIKNNLRKKWGTSKKFNFELKKWMEDNVQFTMVDEYWDSITNTQIDTSVLSSSNRQDADTAISEIQQLKLQKSHILKIYKMVGDSREIIPSNISEEDKHALTTIEAKISDLYNVITQAFKNDNIDMSTVFNTEKVTPQFNKSFYQDFLDLYGIRYEDATFEQIESFFLTNGDVFSNSKIVRYNVFKKALNTGIRLDMFDDMITEMSEELGITDYRVVTDVDQKLEIKEQLLKLYLRSNVQSWYKRYDADTDYSAFVNDMEKGVINIEQLLDNYVNSNTDDIIYNNSVLTMMKMSPSLKYNSPIKKTVQEIYENEYLDESKSDLEKWDILEEMADYHNLPSEYRVDRSEIKNNPQTLRLYIQAMDWHLNSLEKYDMLKSRYIFQQIQMPKTEIERAKELLVGDKKREVLIDTMTRAYQYRTDEMEDAYKNQKVLPKLGFVKLTEAEVSNDWLATLAWQSYQSNLYQQRSQKYSLAVKIMSANENLKYSNGKKPTDTNYHKMMQEMMDHNFFGKSTTYKYRLKLFGGHEIDMAKVANSFRRWTIKMALAYSPIVAMTNVTSGLTNYQILKWVGKKIYSPVDNKVNSMIIPLYGDSIKDIGSFDPKSRLNKILYSFGVYEIEKRYENAQFNKAARLYPNFSFGAMSVGNFVLQSKVVLAKLLENRLINGDFYTWQEYYREQKTLNPELKDSDVKAEFEKYKDKSMYSYINDNGDFNMDALKKDGYTKNITQSKTQVMGQIRDISEQVTMEIYKANEGYASRDPVWSFVLSLKKWMVLANTTMFSRERVDIQSGGKDVGLYKVVELFAQILKQGYKDQKNFKEAYNSLEEHERDVVRHGMILLTTMVSMLALAIVLKGWADDDDEEDPSYLKQLATYMVLRNLNETASGNIGIGDSYYTTLQNPIMTLGTIGNLAKLTNVSNLNNTVKRGKYKGENKWVSDAIKTTWLKNLYTFKDANTIRITREGYTYFNQQSLYHIFELLPEKSNEDEK